MRAACLENGNNRVRCAQIDPTIRPMRPKPVATLTAPTSPLAQIHLQQGNVVKRS